MAFPALILAISITAAFQKPELWHAMVAIGVVAVPLLYASHARTGVIGSRA